jgi:hypothetical protein
VLLAQAFAYAKEGSREKSFEWRRTIQLAAIYAEAGPARRRPRANDALPFGRSSSRIDASRDAGRPGLGAPPHGKRRTNSLDVLNKSGLAEMAKF